MIIPFVLLSVKLLLINAFEFLVAENTEVT